MKADQTELLPPLHGDIRPLPGGHEHILMAEDDDHVGLVIGRGLQNLGYRITAVGSAEQALETLRDTSVQGIPRPDLLLADLDLGAGMDGAQLAHAARILYPDLNLLFMSGLQSDVIFHELANLGAEFLSKPFLKEHLAAKVRAALDRTIRLNG